MSSSALPASGSPRLHGLDTLRAAAIVLVFAYHYQVFVSGEATFGWLSWRDRWIPSQFTAAARATTTAQRSPQHA